ncbi:uncharacterized protein FIBRA_07422 [Fibroporia radiculosa]|uniref:J domain-containing protein n=1 Tax=Fibroporia radiculosa TaxID=599839 RepID=J4I0N3_9APHY|nr:uncharacterized protein FIBRA_07422 [Fibroporia radiculosa]CCM05212.1 predicted protein [Fibroporia radiculosa]
MLNSVLSFVGWSILPNLITTRLLPVFHQLYQNILHRPVPAPNTPLYKQHVRYVYAFTVTAYLLYDLQQAVSSMQPNYYELLGAKPMADENELKLAFRQFARKNHPDRAGPDGEEVFMEVRDAFEKLKNPITRFAYDRFGPSAMQWTHCSTLREYVHHGLMQSAGFYIASLCLLFLISSIGKPSYVAFWRYLLFAAVFAYELKLILSPSTSTTSISLPSLFLTTSGSSNNSSIFGWLWPEKVAYQHVRFLHSLFTSLSIALSRVAPVLYPPQDDSTDLRRLHGVLEQIRMLAGLLNRDVHTQIQAELHAVHGPKTCTQPTGATLAHLPPCENPADEVIDLLTEEMEHMVIERHLLDGGPLKNALDAAVEQGRRAADQQATLAGTGMPSPTPSPPPQPPGKSSLRNLQFPLTSPVNLVDSSEGGYVRGRSVSY